MGILRRLWTAPVRLREARGDTIVEVMIAIGVISLVLTAAYALTNRNTLRSQAVQEHSYGVKLVESEVELLRANGPLGGSDTCYGTDGSPTSGTSCNIVNGGATYATSITATGQPNEYKVTAKWDSVLGGKDEVTMYYRVTGI